MASTGAPVVLASTGFLVGVILIAASGLIVLRFAALALIGSLGSGVRRLAPRVAGSAFWTRSRTFRLDAQNRFPRVYRTVSDRVGVASFKGLPLTLIVIASLYTLATLGGLVDDVRHNAGVVRLDQGVDTFFTPYRSDWLLAGFLWITAISAGPSLTATLCCATVLLMSGTRRRLVVPLWIAFLGAQATTWSSKYIIARPRPVFLPDITEWNPSFPSGHSTASTALIGMLGYIVACSVPGWRRRFDVAFSTVVVIGLVCFSRLFLGVHFFTDVLAGILVGAFWLLVGVTVTHLRAAKASGV